TTMESKTIQIFVSMPYGRDKKSREYWQRFYTIGINGIRQLFEGRGYTAEFVRPKEEVSALLLKEGVIKLLDRCDACLGVITGLNPNVFWEVGYSAAKGKPVIFVVGKGVDEAEYSPVLVADALKVYYDGTIFDDDVPDKSRLTDFQYALLKFLDVAKDIIKGIE